MRAFPVATFVDKSDIFALSLANTTQVSHDVKVVQISLPNRDYRARTHAHVLERAAQAIEGITALLHDLTQALLFESVQTSFRAALVCDARCASRHFHARPRMDNA